ncbi:MAG: AAA family ATPase [Candidatus ainarchaeum sp.]|nr:AAA family ATPase [Candidatus ainarchaeum sp.]
MVVRTEQARIKICHNLSEIVNKFHFAPLDEGLNGKPMHKNVVLMALSYILDRNHLLVGEPGWGKTTGAKIVCSKMSGLPYDIYDAVEIRGNPQKYEEKVVGRPDYGRLNKGEEAVVWQGTFGVDAIIVDEGNRLPYDTQDVLLQGIDTGRWNYLNHSMFAGKKPAFMTVNERTGYHQNGLLPALKDRFDIFTEEGFWTTMVVSDFAAAKAAVQAELCDAEFTMKALGALAKDYASYEKALTRRPVNGHLTCEEKTAIQEEIRSLSLTERDNDGAFFLQAFMAEINYSGQYGFKRSSDPLSPDTHDKNYAGVHVKHSFSPRSAMAVEDYARALAWLLQEKPSIDHVRFVLPHVFGHKAEFSDDYKNAHGGDARKTNETLHLAKTLVEDVAARYVSSIQPMKNFISRLQKTDLTDRELREKKVMLSDGTPVSLKPEDHDHPLMKDFVTQAVEGDRKAFYEVE